MKFTVERSKWLRGGKDGCLLSRKKNKMCCLGFVCKQLGMLDEDIEIAQMPSSLRLPLREQLTGILLKDASGLGHHFDMDWVKNAADLNDNSEIQDGLRERSLTDLFGVNGHELIFVD